MATIGTLVSSGLNFSTNIPTLKPDQSPHVFAFTDGYEVAIYGRSSIADSYYAVYNGSAWNSTPTSLGTAFPAALSTANVALCQVGNTVYSLYSTGSVLSLRSFIWNPSTHSATTANVSSVSGTYSSDAVALVWDSTHSCFYAALGNASSGAVTLLTLDTSATILHTQTVNGYFTTPSGASACYGSYSLSFAQNGQSASTIVLVGNTGKLLPITTGTGGTITPTAMETWGPSSGIIGIDTAYNSSGAIDIVYSRIVSTQNSLATIQRTGTATYSSITTIDSNTGTSTSGALAPAIAFSISANASTGDLWVFYTSTANQANGEVYLAKRTSGTWATGYATAGGDSNGYKRPSCVGSFTSSGCDVIYAYGNYAAGSGTAYAVYAARQLNAATPNTPTGLTPTGTTGLTASPPVPSLAWTYSNTIATDTQGAYELVVTRTADSHVMWDSGKVTSSAASGITYGGTSNTGDANYVAPTNLSYGVQYQWSVRVWDSVGNTNSSYSTALTFTPQQSPQCSITGVASPTGGTASPGSAASTLASATAANATSLTVQSGKGASFTVGQKVASGVTPTIDLVTIGGISGDTLTVTAMTHAHSSTDPVVQAGNTLSGVASPTFDITVEVQQASGNSITQYTASLYDATGTTRIATTGTVTLGTSVSPGSTFTITDWAPSGLANSTTYLLQVTVTDGTTSLTGTSAQWSLTTSYTAPSAPTGIECLANSTTGTVTLAWTNPGSITSTNVYWRQNGTSTWTLVASGTLRTSIILFPPLNVAYDYAVEAVNGYSVTSAKTTVLNQTLGLKYGAYGVWLNDITAPTTYSVALGGVEDWQSASLFDHVEDAVSYVPAGRPAPITSYGVTDYWTAVQRKYFVPASDTDGTTTTLGADVIAMAKTMNRNHRPVLYRDVDGVWLAMEIRNIHTEKEDSIHYLLQLDLLGVDVSTIPVV